MQMITATTTTTTTTTTGMRMMSKAQMMIGRVVLLLLLLMMINSRAVAIPTPVRLDLMPHEDMNKVTEFINITRYGNNLCHECRTRVSPCIVSTVHRCFFTRNGEVLVSKVNGTTDIDFSQETADMATASPELNRRRRRRRKRAGADWTKDFDESGTKKNDDDSQEKHDWRSSGMCRYNYTKRCWEKRCEMKCCDGSAMNSGTNGCPESDDEDGSAVDSCMNGGTVSSDKTHCLCTVGFSGIRCQNRKCSVTCQNGGICQTKTKDQSGSLSETTHNDDHCVCPVDTTGKFCETRKCSLECQNNGTCRTNRHGYYYNSWCHCQQGYHGQFCQKGGLKEGQCPLWSSMKECSWMKWRNECHEDKDCSGTKKCCTNACHQTVCSYPLNDNATCHFRNQTYTLDTTFKPDSCHLCTCNASHVGAPQGVIECARIRCPDVSKYCTNVVTHPGQCCPVCEESPNVAMCAGNYTPPYFTNCPSKLVVVEVDSPDTNLATLELGLKARDCNGDSLNVLLSQVAAMAGQGEENFQLVTATSHRDRNDHFAECAFHIWVKDPFPPEFVTCPADMVVPRPGPVTWPVPQAKDNVGIAKPPTSRRKPHIRLNTGEYAIEYFTEDFHANPAVCTFIITVEDGYGPISGNGNHSNPHDYDGDYMGHHGAHDKPHDQGGHPGTAIGMGVGTTLVVVLLVCLAAFFWRRKRIVLQNAGTPQAAANRWNLNAGAGTGGGGGSSGGVPQYSLPPEDVMSPPSYSRVDDMIAGLGAASGGQEAGELPSKTSAA